MSANLKTHTLDCLAYLCWLLCSSAGNIGLHGTRNPGIAMLESPKKCNGSDVSGSINGLTIRAVRDALLNPLMGTFFIEIGTVFFYQSPQMHFMKNQGMIQAFPLQTSHKSFAYGIGFRCTKRSFYHLDTGVGG
jgi:hypothetical protein